MLNPILFVGGTGVVGSRAIRVFRERHPDVPLLVGGRKLDAAQALAAMVGNAEAIAVDVDRHGLGLESGVSISAIAVMAPDKGLNGLMLAQDRGVPYIGIGTWLVETGAELAHFVRRPDVSAIVLASHWHGGPSVFLTKALVKGMDAIHSVRIGALVDDQDATGPAAIEDMEAGGEQGSGALAFVDGRRAWLRGDAARRMIETIDGRQLEAQAFAPYDIVSIQAETGARDVRFDLAMAPSSSRLRGDAIGTEVTIEVEGQADGEHCRRRSTMEFTKGQAVLTGFSATLALSNVLGLEGRPPVKPGLYFPETVMQGDWFLDQLVGFGAKVTFHENQPAEPTE